MSAISVAATPHARSLSGYRRIQEMQIEEREGAEVVADAMMVGQERRFNSSVMQKLQLARQEHPEVLKQPTAVQKALASTVTPHR